MVNKKEIKKFKEREKKQGKRRGKEKDKGKEKRENNKKWIRNEKKCQKYFSCWPFSTFPQPLHQYHHTMEIFC